MQIPTHVTMRSGAAVMQVRRSNCRLTSVSTEYLLVPRARSACETGTSVTRLAKRLASTGMKVCRSLQSSMASTTRRR